MSGAVNGTSSEAEASVDMDVVYGQQPNGNSSKGYNKIVPDSGLDMYGTKNMPHASGDHDSLLGAVGADKDGYLVVKDRFWSVFCKEVEEIFESIHGPMSDQQFEEHSRLPAMSISNHQPGSRFHNFLLRHTSAARFEEDAYPPPSQMAYLWRIYVENVDPFVKILHVPSMAKIIDEIRDDYHSLSASMHALVMAVAFAAVMSLDDAEVCENFGTSKNETLAGYRLATERSLERVDLLDEPEMPALEALTLYLSVLQSIGETQSTWVLAGCLARSAACLKSSNNANGSTSDVFEKEMQRRLWGQISILDSRPPVIPMSENNFLDVKYDTKPPANLNDVDLYHGMSDPAKVAKGWTDTTTSIIRIYIRKLSLWLQDTAKKPPFKLGQMETHRTVMNEMIEYMWLQHVDPNKPLHCFVAASARLFMTKVELLLQAKQRAIKTSHRMPTIVEESPNLEVFASALTIIELIYNLQKEPKWKRWRWQLHGLRPPYQAIRVVLTHLCTNPLDRRSVRTLSVVQGTLDSVSESAREDPAHRHVVDLLASAAQRRQACTTHDAGVQTDNPPSSYSGSDDLTSENALNSLKSLAPRWDGESGAQKEVLRSSSTSQEQEPVPRNTAATPVGNASDETLALEMDWEELAREMEPCLGAWNAYA